MLLGWRFDLRTLCECLVKCDIRDAGFLMARSKGALKVLSAPSSSVGACCMANGTTVAVFEAICVEKGFRLCGGEISLVMSIDGALVYHGWVEEGGTRREYLRCSSRKEERPI